MNAVAEGPIEARAGKRGHPYRAGAELVLSAIRRHPLSFTIAIAGASIFAVLTVVSAWALGRVVDRVIEPTFLRGRIPSASIVASALGLYIATAIGRGAGVIVRRSFAGRWQHSVAASDRSDVIDRLLAQPLSWIRQRHVGDLLAVADNDPEAAISMLATVPYSFGSLVLMAAAAIWLVAVDPVLGIVAVIVMPIIAITNTVFVRFSERPAERIQQSVASLSDNIHETVDGIAVVKMLGAKRVRRDATAQTIEALRQSKLAQLRIQVVFDGVMDLVPAAMTVLLLFVGALRVKAGTLRIGEVVGAVQLFERLVWPLRMLAYTMAALPRSVAGRARVLDVVRAPLVPKPRFDAPTNPKNAVELSDIALVHADGRAALSDVSIEIVRGERVAVVGATASGKTTLLNVIAGLDAPTAGQVRRSVDQPTYVFQEPLLFSGSIRDNVSFTASDGPEIERAVELSCAAEFVGALDQRLNTIVGERGVTLSGGQRQRVALARALVRRPQLLLLDDTTSSLDPTTEARVLESLNRRDVAETVIVVAARPSTIALVDRVIFLNDGRVEATGSDAELAATVPGYAAIVSAYNVEETST